MKPFKFAYSLCFFALCSLAVSGEFCSAQEARAVSETKFFNMITYQRSNDDQTASAPLVTRDPSEQNAPTNPDATFKGCWYKQGTRKYQAIALSVKNPGTYAFDAVLYHGTTCNANDYADSLSQNYPFEGFGYIFWFDRFGNQNNMSAVWNVGPDTSGCVKYTSSTPLCN
jgi:hypothetical protein